MMNAKQRFVAILALCQLIADFRLANAQIIDISLCLNSQPPSACLFEATAGFDQCVDPLLHVCYYEGDKNKLEPRDSDLGGINESLPSGGGSIVCNLDGTCGEEPTPNRDTCVRICKSCTYKDACNCIYTNPDQYCPIPGFRSDDYNAVQPNKWVACNRDGTCSDQADAPGWDTCCGNCASCSFKGCCHCSFTDPNTYCPIPGARAFGYRGGNRNFVNCKEDGNCAVEDTPKADTCCGNCASCTFNGCCHCSYTDPTKNCPIPGWRSEDYTGDGGSVQPRGVNDPGRCGDPVQLARILSGFAAALFTLYSIANQNPYRVVPWTQVMNQPNPRRPFPEVGHVQLRRIDNHPNNAERVEYLEREIRPQDLHERTGGFTSAQRTQGFRNLGGNFQTDEAGHILANTLGGPDNMFNFFPQHRSVNANRGSRWILDSWVDTETRIRNFLNTQTVPGPNDQNARSVQLSVYLIYDDESEGRPSEITWTAIFMNGGQQVGGQYAPIGGRVYNSGRDGNGVQATCPKSQTGGRRR